MTTAKDPMFVPANESGKLRIFTTDLPPEGASAITPTNVEKLLGTPVEPRKVEIVPHHVVKDMGLSNYLAEGYGISPKSLEGRKAAIDALSGLVIFLPSSAFQGQEATIDPDDSLRFVGLFEEEPQRAHDMTSSAPKPAEIEPGRRPHTPQQSMRTRSSLIALGALIIAAALLSYFFLN